MRRSTALRAGAARTAAELPPPRHYSVCHPGTLRDVRGRRSSWPVVKRLVYAAADPRTGAAGSVFNILQNRTN